MNIPECLMLTMMSVVAFFDWLIYKTPGPPDAFHDDGLGWGLQRRWMEDTYGLRRAYKPGCITVVFVILVLIGYFLGRADYL